VLALIALGLLTLAAQDAPAPDVSGLWGLGVIAVALVVGAGLTYRYVAVPERARADKAEARADASFEREREAYQVTTPVVTAASEVMGRVLSVLTQPERAP
jgi:hypothetical protein